MSSAVYVLHRVDEQDIRYRVVADVFKDIRHTQNHAAASGFPFGDAVRASV